MSTRKLTIRLPEEEIDFAKRYASNHGMTMTELINRYLKELRTPFRWGLESRYHSIQRHHLRE